MDINVGLAGTGFIGPAHLEGLRRNNISVIGLAEQTSELARKKASELGLSKAYSSFDEMISDPRINVVHLATPNHLHYSQVKAALLAGKHVVCEKPLAMNSAETGELVKLAKEKNLVNAINFNLRFYPLVQEAHFMVAKGEIGTPYIIQGSYLQDWLLYETDWNWRLEPNLGGSMRAVSDIGSHWLDLVTFVTGLKIEKVFADFKTFLPTRKKPAKPVETYSGKILKPEDYIDQPITTEDYASILLHFENGSRGVLSVAQVCAGRKNRLFFEVNASKKSLSWDSEHPNDLWIGNRDSCNGLLMKDPSLMHPEARQYSSYPGGHQEGFPDTFKQLSARVYAYIQKGDFTARPDFATFEDGHYEMLLGEAIEKSAKENRWVKPGE